MYDFLVVDYNEHMEGASKVKAYYLHTPVNLSPFVEVVSVREKSWYEVGILVKPSSIRFDYL